MDASQVTDTMNFPTNKEDEEDVFCTERSGTDDFFISEGNVKLSLERVSKEKLLR